MRYTVNETTDVAFRRVNVFNSILPEFEPIKGLKFIDCTENNLVYEIKRQDGTTELLYGFPKTEIHYIVTADSKIALPATVTGDRLWVKRNDDTGIAYKVPCYLPVVDQMIKFDFPGDERSVVVFGDKYFEAAFTLRKG